MMSTAVTGEQRLQTGTTRAMRAWRAWGAAFGLIALMGVCASGVRAEEKKADWWCGVIEKQMDSNREAARKAHDSATGDRLRQEYYRLDKEAHDRHCPGH